MRTFVLASMRVHARRYLAAGVAIVIATAFIVAINAISAAARDGARDQVGAQYAGAGVVASGTLDADQGRELAATARATDGVRAAAVNSTGFLEVGLQDVPALMSVGTVAAAPSLRWQELTSGRLPHDPHEALVSGTRAEDEGVGVGDTITVAGRSFTVTGVTANAAGSLGASVYLPETSVVRESLLVSSVVVDTAPGRARQVAGALAGAAGGDGPKVQSATDFVHDEQLRATQGVDVFQKLIFIFAGISLFVSALVIANTFTILLAQRARDFALLRCVGSLRGQLMRSVVLEAAVLAVVASAIGVALGYGLAFAAAQVLSATVPEVQVGTPSLGVGAVAVPVELALLVTVVASVAPARRIARLSPLAALQPRDDVQVRTRAGLVRIASAVVLGVVGGAGLVLGSQAGSLPVAMGGGMLSFLGVLLLGPVLVPGLIALCGPIVGRTGVPGRMAIANALRNPRRTAATSTALLVGVTLITTVVVGTASIKTSVGVAMDDSKPLDMAMVSEREPVPADVLGQVRTVSGIAAARSLDGTDAEVGGSTLPVLGMDRQTAELVHGNAWLRELGDDEIVLPSGQQDVPAVSEGDTVKVRVGDTTRSMRVRYLPGYGTAALVSTRSLAGLADGSAEPRAIWTRATSRADAQDTAGDIAAIAHQQRLDVDGGLPQRAEVMKVLDVVLAITVALLAVAALIALIGVGNTLSLSVLERVRENSLLRALGLERSGLRVMLAIEALAMSLVAAAVGLSLGFGYAWFGLRTVTEGVLDSGVGLSVPWLQVLGIAAVAAVAGLAACVLPGRRAAAVPPAEGLLAD